MNSVQVYSLARVPKLQTAWNIVGQVLIDSSFINQVSALPTIQRGSYIGVENCVLNKRKLNFSGAFL